MESDVNHSHAEHVFSLSEELACHFPYATFSVTGAFIVIALLHFVSLGFTVANHTLQSGYHILFHVFHYIHLVFAVTGTFVAFTRFSQSMVKAVLVSLVSPAIFCTLSDIALPSLAGNLVGVPMAVHICFFSLHDLMNLLPFMILGLMTGYAISRHHRPALRAVSLGAHFIHILISALAATFYTASFGFDSWYSVMGPLCFLLVLAVVVPCTISDVVVPAYFSRRGCTTS